MNPQYSRYYTYVKPLVTNPYVRTYSTLIFSLIAITFFSLFAIRPTVKTIFGLQKSIEEQKQVLNQLIQKSQDLETGRRNFQSIDSNPKDSVDTLLPNKTNLPRFIDQLSLLALQNQASISGLQFQPLEINDSTPSNTANPSLQEISFTFNAQGKYNQIVGLLDSLSLANRLLSIDLVNLTKNDQGIISMSINGKAYYLR